MRLEVDVVETTIQLLIVLLKYSSLLKKFARMNEAPNSSTESTQIVNNVV
jgi:hypothetical protein